MHDIRADFDGSTMVHEGDENDELADLLSDPHCRLLLKSLHERNEPVSVSTVTRTIVAEITGTEPADVPDGVSRRVQTWLHLGQLPLLDEHGVVDFDPEVGTVALPGNSRG